MRKRAQRLNPVAEIKPHVVEQVKSIRKKRNYFIPFVLICTFFLVLFFNTYFNVTSGIGINPDGDTFEEKFYLAGPDPYYNMRTIRRFIDTGAYPFDADPLLTYPMGLAGGFEYGGGARPPMMNMMAVGLGHIFGLFIPFDDAIGYAMQFLPALFGALLVFPVYIVGRSLFGSRAGVIGAFLVALIPIHLGSGHGSAFTLFDHDSLNLFLTTCMFAFFILGIKEKNTVRAVLYGVLAGVFLGALSLTWVEAQYAYAIISLYFIVQLSVNLFRKKTDFILPLVTMSALLVGNLISFPYVFMNGIYVELPVLLLFLVCALGVGYYLVKKKNVPWILTVPSLFILGGCAVAIIYFFKDVPIPAIHTLNQLLFGRGVYGDKISMTIAEASTYSISRTVMSFGPTLYWLAWVGFIYMMYRWMRENLREEYLFAGVMFIVSVYFTSIAGRFLNDMVPWVAIFSGFIVVLVIDKCNYKKMIVNVREIGGLHGIRKAIKIYHILGVAFLVFLILLPNSYLALHTAVPSGSERYNRTAMFGSNDLIFGVGTYKEIYWVDALDWLNDQDTDKPAEQRPCFISWWDYGFYEVAVGKHPTVADNYQRGIPTASNFQTAKTEEEAIAVLILRLAEGDWAKHNKSLSSEVKDIFMKYLPDRNETREENNETVNITLRPGFDIINIINDAKTYAPSYNSVIAPKWGNTEWRVNEVNAMYHDGVRILSGNLSDEQLVWLYDEMQKQTGWSIRYYGVEGYDMDIFNVFSFLSDKGTYGYITGEDDYFKTIYVDKNNREYTPDQIKNLTDQQIQNLGPFNPKSVKKDAYYESMVYKAYRGIKDGGVPSYLLKHFKPVYISPYPYPGTEYPAVIILKYYMGCYVNGTVTVEGTPYAGNVISVTDEYGIPHDWSFIDGYGKYHLIAPPGNITLQILIGQNEVYSKTFNETEGLFSPITELEADRIGTYARNIDINLVHGSLSGCIVNATADRVKLDDEETDVDETGYYNFVKKKPGQYELKVFSKGIELTTQSVFIGQGETTYNVTIETGVLEGYFNDPRENMTVELKGEKGTKRADVNATTGYYLIRDIVPYVYNITLYLDDTISVMNATVNISKGYNEYNLTVCKECGEEDFL